MRKLGILERQKGPTIDEKIAEMDAWLKRYPGARLVDLSNVDAIIRKYALNDIDYDRLKDEYRRMQRYYDYVRARKSKGKLTEEQILKCKESNFGGILGYSDNVERISKQLQLSKNKVVYLLEKYGSIENFYNLYQNKKIDDVNDRALAALKIKRVIDIDSKENDSAYDMLMEDLIINEDDSEIDLMIYSSQKLKELIQELPIRERVVLERRYDLNGEGFPKTLENIAVEVGLSREGLRQLEEKIQKKIRYIINESCIWKYKDLKDVMSENEKNEHSKLEEIIMNVRLNNITYYDEEVVKQFDFLKTITTEYNERKAKSNRDSIEEDLTGIYFEDTIDELDIPERASNILRKLGYHKVQDIVEFTEEDFSGMKGIGKGSIGVIIEELKPYRKLFGIQEIEPSELQLLKMQRYKLRKEKKTIKVKKCTSARIIKNIK